MTNQSRSSDPASPKCRGFQERTTDPRTAQPDSNRCSCPTATPMNLIAGGRWWRAIRRYSNAPRKSRLGQTMSLDHVCAANKSFRVHDTTAKKEKKRKGKKRREGTNVRESASSSNDPVPWLSTGTSSAVLPASRTSRLGTRRGSTHAPSLSVTGT